MQTGVFTRSGWTRPTAWLLLGALSAPTMGLLAGCGGQPAQNTGGYAPPPPGFSENSQPANNNRGQQQAGGLSGRQKMVLLAGAAALYYIYRKRQAAANEGPQGKYYLSKNGRVYYRDLKTGRYQWVSPPTQPIQVPADELAQYGDLSRYQGYNNNARGQGFGGYGSGNARLEDAVPAQYGGGRY